MMRFLKYIILLGILNFCGCNKERKAPQMLGSDSLSKNDTLLEKEIVVKSTVDGSAVKEQFDDFPRDTVVEIENGPILKDSNYKEQAKCLDWKLSPEDILNVLRLSERISSEDLHLLYYTVSCQIEGKILINNDLYNFKINGGSYIYLSGKKEKMYFGCADDKCKKYFLAQGGNGERDGLDQ